jgi:dolichol-phosphate mannosyltransferase
MKREISIVTSAHNEGGNITEFLDKVEKALMKNGMNGQIIAIDDGSTDNTLEKLADYNRHCAKLRIIHNHEKQGLSNAINTGMELATGHVIILLPADLESDPEEDIPKLVNKLDEGFDIATGWRQNRKDRKSFSSSSINLLCRLLFGISVHDMNWIKAFKKEAVRGLKLTSGWFRYLIPILSTKKLRIGEVKTNWYPRKYGKSKFGLSRFIISIYDLMMLLFLLKFRKNQIWNA